MILILTDEHEPTSDLVVDWLLYLKKPFIRISANTPIIIHKIYICNGTFEAEFSFENIYGELNHVSTENIESFWYRRSNVVCIKPKLNIDTSEVNKMFDSLITEEYISIQQFFYTILENKNHINAYKDGAISKMKVLEYALKYQVKIPDTIICSHKKELEAFYKKHNGKIITKTIGDPFALYYESLTVFTSQVVYSKIPNTFALSLFQEMLDKEFEIRSFFLKNTFYSSAIFSQKDKSTKIDFRHYNTTNPNRVVPFQLPKDIEAKLKKLMERLELNCGSIDLVYTKKGDYVFLEVNPVGQFEQVSFPCNYNLFKEIALTL